ncbi:DUF4259 domain-containing protein [Arthrobacter glacialis]|nr:DUF4259 domain-containing protein [Arthrobacter glacialis]POH61157.1 hypothetical protein CVS28_01265 [Arthrobacter glacialis]
MGTWDASVFGNDDAADYLYELDNADTFAKIVPVLEAALDFVLDALDEIEAPAGAVGIAAAALVAAWEEPSLLGSKTTDVLLPWPRTNDPVPERLRTKASQVLDRMQDVRGNELAELWEESGEFPEFSAEVSHWRSRLGD